jgi:hypothetical protein
MARTIAEVEEERGRLAQARADLRQLLEARFDSLPPSLVERINTTEDLAKLSAALVSVVKIKSLDEFRL